MEAFGERQLAVFDPLLGRKPPEPPMNLFNGAEAEDGDVEVARDALQLAQAEAMGGSHDGEAPVVKPLALEGLAPGDLQLWLVAGQKAQWPTTVLGLGSWQPASRPYGTHPQPHEHKLGRGRAGAAMVVRRGTH